MNARHLRTLLFCVTAIGVSFFPAPRVDATIAPPVEMRLTGPPDFARRGEVFRGELEILSDIDVGVAGLRLKGEGWRSLSLKTPLTAALAKGRTQRLPFEVVPTDPEALLEFSLELDGFTVHHAFDLSERHYREMFDPVEAVSNPAGRRSERAGTFASRSDLAMPEPVLPDDVQAPLPSDVAKANLRVHGRFVYDAPAPFGDFGADGMSITVWNIDGLNSTVLGTGISGPWGHFDFTVPWTGTPTDPHPNIWIHFEAANSWVDVRDDDYSDRYDWYWGTAVDYPSLDLDVGELRSSVAHHDPALFILSMATRAHRWLRSQPDLFYELPSVGVRWPFHLPGASYSPSTINIRLSVDLGYSCGQLNHEMGHHWQHAFAAILPFNYCNQPGEVPPCGHGVWCWEYDPISWFEGFPDWFSVMISNTFDADYGEPGLNMNPYFIEALGTCNGVFDDPMTTEGFMAALLLDISDDNQDTHGVFGPWGDTLAMGADEIFLINDIYTPVNAQDFLDRFESLHPIYKEDFWETGMNCGFNSDDDPPGTVSNLVSTSHDTVGDWVDPTIEYAWTRAFDDASGLEGYSIEVSHLETPPDLTLDIGRVIKYTTPPLTQGDWYFTIRAVDRDGKWSPDYRTYGPVTIRPAIPVNLEYPSNPFWAYPLVPRNAGDATPVGVFVSPTLDGNTATTWWNLNGRNSGEISTGSSFGAYIYVDGAVYQTFQWGIVGAGAGFFALNRGPFTVWGGRHTMSARIDASDSIPETDETDNEWGHQWVWTPLSMSANSPVLRAAPPPRTGGWEHVVDGSTLYWNCDGLRFRSTGYGNAFYVRTIDPTMGYDARLFAPSTGSGNGFAVPIAESWSGPGALDVFVVNRHVESVAYWDVGVLNNHDPISGSYQAEHVTSTGLFVQTTTAKDMLADDMVDVWQFYVDAELAGPVSIWMDADSAEGVLWLLYYDETFGVGGVADADAFTSNQGRGGRIDVDAAAQGWHTLVVYRDTDAGTGPRNYTLRVDRTPSELHPVLDLNQDWYAPLVPRPTPDGTPALVPMPTILYGNASATYLNVSTRNSTATPASAVWGNLKIDGGDAGALYWGTYSGDHIDYWNSTSPWFVRGGRHTLSIVMDEADTVPELDETNNGYSSQWSWTPYDLTEGVPIIRASPAARTGGWQWAWAGSSLSYNCDGLRLPQGGDTWRAVAIVPGAAADLDLHVFDPMTNATDGFTASLAYSGWLGPEIDFVVINGALAADQDYDVGVMRTTDTVQNYTAEAVGEASLMLVNEGSWGPFPLGAGHLMALHPVWLDPGPLSVGVHNVDGVVDWGVTLHPADEAFASKTDIVSDAFSWTHLPGEDEGFVTEIVDPGVYCLAVWKHGHMDVNLAGSYAIQMRRSSTDAPSFVIPEQTALVGIYPNPFNPSTRIEFDLAEPGPVRVDIHDARGRCVRTLVDEPLPARRHALVWYGLDDRGAPVASGVYHARLVAGAVVERGKLVLLK